jgi:choline dehydrogenase-like flavoprotein
MAEKHTDYIVIGGGTADCVLASRLHQAAPHLTTLLLEAGPDQHSNPHITLPLNGPMLDQTPLEWKYAPLLNNRQLYNYSGKVLSGSSAVNYGSWTRGPKVDCDLWAEVVGD